jgi:pimeloyl-ACP methyl ester carboxylesterase
MTATVERERVAQVPLLIVRPNGSSAPLPTVLWLHGFGASKEVHLPELQRLTEAGLLAVGVDAVAHGERRRVDLEQQFTGLPHDNARLFGEIVRQTAAELPLLIDSLVERGLSDPQRIAVAGVSMGGCIVYGAIPLERRIRTAVALLASPEWALPPGVAVERFYPTALLSITAAQDTIVPPAAAQALHERLTPLYRVQEDRLHYHEIAGVSHFMPAVDWASAVARASAWLSRFLR